MSQMANLLNILTGRTFLIGDSFFSHPTLCCPFSLVISCNSCLHTHSIVCTLFIASLFYMMSPFMCNCACFCLSCPIIVSQNMYASEVSLVLSGSIKYVTCLVIFHDMCLLCLVISNNLCLLSCHVP